MVFTSFSIATEWRGLLGGAKYQVSLSSYCNLWCVLSVFRTLKTSCVVFFPLTYSPLLSKCIMLSLPILLQNLLRAMIKDSVDLS